MCTLGTVLGPLLVLVFTNDLPEVIKHSSVKLFSDDCILFKHIKSSDDAMKLQQDLTSLEDWEQQWQMKVHTEKCSDADRHQQPYQEGHKLLSARTHPRSRVIEQVPWSQYQRRPNMEDHIKKTASKANRTVDFLRRNMGKCSKRVRNAAYVSLVRPVVEYACAAWDPHTTEDINRLDEVQRRSARFVCINYRDRTPGCVTQMTKNLNWEQLPDRRREHRLAMLYKIVDVDASDIS